MNHEQYMSLALQQAKQAAQRQEVPVGAVLVLADGTLFQAHNQPITQSDPSAHAEVQVIRNAAKHTHNYRLTGAVLYVTLEPCIMCAGLLLQARIQTLVYGAPEPKTGAVQSLYQLLNDPRLNHQVTIITPVLAEDSAQLLRDFFRERRKAKKELKTGHVTNLK